MKFLNNSNIVNKAGIKKILSLYLLNKVKGKKKNERNKHKAKVDINAKEVGIPPNCCKQIYIQ